MFALRTRTHFLTSHLLYQSNQFIVSLTQQPSYLYRGIRLCKTSRLDLSLAYAGHSCPHGIVLEAEKLYFGPGYLGQRIVTTLRFSFAFNEHAR